MAAGKRLSRWLSLSWQQFGSYYFGSPYCRGKSLMRTHGFQRCEWLLLKWKWNSGRAEAHLDPCFYLESLEVMRRLRGSSVSPCCIRLVVLGWFGDGLADRWCQSMAGCAWLPLSPRTAPVPQVPSLGRPRPPLLTWPCWQCNRALFFFYIYISRSQ